MEKPSVNPLETEAIPRLIARYSIPTALTLMVNYLYNIVDQIFVGQGVGITGMAATNIAFPLAILVNAVSLMLGDGCAANISLSLGRKQQEEADKTLSHTVTLLITCGVLAAVITGLFAPWIVRAFGATDTAYDQSLAYMRTIAWGIPFQLLSPAMTAIIRADGRPTYAMKCMVTGAVINLVLDPIFIFPLHMGVVGAGIATVAGQVVSGILFLRYLPRFQTVHVRKAALRPERARALHILALGIPSMLTQLLTALVQIVMNNLMTKWGAFTAYGSDIALSVYGMMMKVYQICHSMFVGVSSATQPINGYNFGAKRYDRVRETYRMAAAIALAISVLWFVIFQVFPRQIGSLFVNNDPVYLDCAAHCFRLYMLAFFVYGLHMTTASFFQSIGKPSKSLLLPLARQGIFLIPLALLLSAWLGLDGALLAAPVADALSFLLSVGLALSEFRSWRKDGRLPPRGQKA
ncbi:MAG: MATE family efflux transporter [Evtepia sp.]|uniref:MATE family efflux transporter n=1 Tax=Evtepia sp. TaxID=2773933 RepID=UPI002A751AF3|nr:MATE family efflux transporter [Evtepia sp.]MDY3015416.1 MATE family efflux transporter [Evtepia sp.]